VHEPSGLRFDVYERVHLPQDAADIREIEEVELTPCVQAERQGDQVVLRGSLLLGGVYLPDDESRNSRQLEHWIPVEITLPLERVSRLEDLAVEVDNFDVDLLDKRTLNVTGVLTLRGIEAGALGSRQQTYAWGEEPYTVVHRRGRELVEDEAPESAGESAQSVDEAEPSFTAADAAPASDETSESAQELAEWRNAGGEDAFASESADNAGDPSSESASFDGGSAAQPELQPEAVQSSGPVEWKEFAARAQENLAAAGSAVRANEPESGSGQDAEQDLSAAGSEEASDVRIGSGSAEADELTAADSRDVRQADAQPLQTEEAVVAPAAQPGEWSETGGQQPAAQAASGKVDVKVAVNAKRESEPAGAEGSPGLGKLFFPDRREARPDVGARPAEEQEPQEEQEAANAGYRQSSADEVDWKSLFGGAAAQESFRTVRLCIVQKDDTLDAIAGRYQRNPREIALANRLSGTEVTEGQVLYIP